MRRSPSFEASFKNAAPRLACVRPVASVHPEPGSNSSLYYFFLYNSIENFAFSPSKGAARDSPVLTLTFFTRLVLLCLSFSQRSFALFLTASLAVRIGYSRKASAKIEPFFFPTKYFCYFFSSFFTQIHNNLITTLLYRKIFLPYTPSFWRESQIYSQNPLLANLFPCSLTSLYNISTPPLSPTPIIDLHTYSIPTSSLIK